MSDTVFEDTFSEEIWTTTYKDSNDQTIDDTMMRVAKGVAAAEKNIEIRNEWAGKFYQMLSGFKVTSGGRIYSNAGTEWQGTTLMNCIHGDSKIVTSKGTVKANTVANQFIKILTSNGEFKTVKWESYGYQNINKVTFNNGEVIYCTPEHEWLVTKPAGGTEKIITKNLKNRRVPLNGIIDYEYTSNDEYMGGVRNGLVFGDGYVYTDFSNDVKYSALQQFGDSRHLVLDYFKWLKVTYYKGEYEGIHYVNGLDKKLKDVPDNTKSNDYLRGFVAGVIAADGCVTSKGSVVLHTANYDYAVKIKDIAVSVGLPVVSLKLERDISPFDPDKKSELWKLTFVKKYFQNDKKLVIKKSHIEKMNNSPISHSLTTIKCINVESTDKKEEVFCCNEESTHTFTLGEFGLLTGNCFAGPRGDYDIDSLDGILKSLTNQAQTLKSEGGWGDNFSYIRPRGSFIHGIGVESPGAVKYMELFDRSSDIITSGSGKKSLNKKAKGKIRKGAMMGVMDVWHPDIIEFITAKQSAGRLSKFNVSVNCTDEFMEKIIKLDEMCESGASTEEIELMDQWQLRFPDTTHEAYKAEWTGNFNEWVKSGHPVKVFDTVSATMLFNLIMDSTYNRAEPGVLYLDRANYFNPLNYHDTIYTTNPCLSGDCKVLTIAGNKPIIDLIDKPIEIWNGFEFSEVVPKITGTNKNMVSVNLSNGISIRCTENHKWVLSDNSRVKAVDLVVGNKLAKFNYPIIPGDDILDDAYSHGFYAGDGWTSNGNFYIGLYGDKKNLVNKFDKNISIHEYKISGGYPGTDTTQTKLYINMGRDFGGSKTFVPDTKYNISSRLEWLAGILDSDGYKTKCSCLQLSAKNRDFLSDVQMMLTTLGVASSVNSMKECWRLSISATNAYKLQDIGLVLYRLGRIEKPSREAGRFIKVVSVEDSGVEDVVYCFTEDKNHTGVFNGVMTAQCGEQTLAPAGVCDLASINLTQFIIEHKDGSVSFDFKKFKEQIPVVVRFLDNINDISNAPLPEYEASMKDKRRIGIGILGWGSLLFMMRTRFGGGDAAKLRDKIMKTLAQESYKASIDLAIEKGMFPLCDPEKHAENPFIKSLNLPKEYIDKLRTTGIRNSAILSIQPTGNTSIFANIVSGGLEPIFMPEYIRTVIENVIPDHLIDVTPKWFEGQWFETELFKFAKEGDEEILRGVDEYGTTYKIDNNRGLTKEVLCEDYGVRWLKGRGLWDAKADWAVTTVELTAEEHLLDMEGFARWIDAAISKTINIPNDYPYEDFKNIYIDAYKSGTIKGVTTYRAGTMTTVLSAKDEKDIEHDDEEIILDDVKMPDSAPAVMKTIRAEGKKWYLTIVKYENTDRPFALFVKTNSHEKSVNTNDAVDLLMQLAKDKHIPKSHVADVSRKIGSDSNASKITRMISFLLRHGVLIKSICLVLDKVQDVYVGSFIFQIKKFLQTYIRDGEVVDGEVCTECGGKMFYSEGCFKCMDCGNSKCG